MREDIKKLIESRPLWKLHNNKEYQDIVAAIEYAEKHNNKSAAAELKIMLLELKEQLLE